MEQDEEWINKKWNEFEKDGNTYQQIHEFLEDVIKPIVKKNISSKEKDFEQQWKPVKGAYHEKLLLHFLREDVEKNGMKIIQGKKMERLDGGASELAQIRKKLEICFGDLGKDIPDLDLIIYCLDPIKIIAIVSSKTSLRERASQTAYWKIKLSQNEETKHVKVFFVTIDSDGVLTENNPRSKPRLVVEHELDCTYFLNSNPVKESDKVKNFSKFAHDLEKIKECK